MGMQDHDGYMRLLTKLHDDMGMDFSQYKEGMLRRRIGARIRRNELNSVEGYLAYIDKNPEETAHLINALSINVTEFFRNPDSFEVISRIVVPEVLAEKKKDKHRIIRCWSCGCSVGDEPYSLSMTFLEELKERRKDYLIVMIGSDIDGDALAEARGMTYSSERLKAIAPDLLERYFEETGSGKFKLKSVVTSMVRFREHNVIKDHPFLHCDIILCRNLLIYFNKELQEETLLKFYECLNPGGFLVLGMSESMIGSSAKRFQVVDNRMRVYRRPVKSDTSVIDSRTMGQDQIDRLIKEFRDG